MTTKTILKQTNSKLNKLINNHLSNLPKIGDIVKGKVIESSKKEILIDIDSFTTGVVRGWEVKNLPEEYQKLKPGDEVEAMVIDLENEKGQMELSLKSALIENACNTIKEIEQKQETIDVKITGANKGGLLAVIKGIPAFLPVSQLTQEHYPKVEGGDKKKILKKLKNFIGKTLSVKIINFNPDEEKIIISEKRAWADIQRERLKEYKIGDIVDAEIKTITSFGAFVEFGEGLEGLIHISEINQETKNEDGESKILKLKEEDTVKAKIIDIKGSKVFLTLKI